MGETSFNIHFSVQVTFIFNSFNFVFISCPAVAKKLALYIWCFELVYVVSKASVRLFSNCAIYIFF